MKLKRSVMALAVLLLAALVLPSLPAAVAETPYYITVDITNQIVTIYSTADDSIVRQMLCSTGKYKPTPIGTFEMPKKHRSQERTEWYEFTVLECYAKWASRITGHILFHSLTYNKKTETGIDKKAVERFGSPASHGCIRLLEDDAKFIAENCLAGTKVKIYRSGEPNPDLRAMLRLGTFDINNGLSYKHYLGVAEEEGELGRFSSGPEVRNLQYRLRDLGVFDGELDGEYGTETFVAVRTMQVLMGWDVTGTASLEFQAALFAEDAPTAMAITMTIGHSGPAVLKLQQHLKTLGLYNGEMDGIYDAEVSEAVKVFQTAYGFAADGNASPEMQQAAYYESGKLDLLFSRCSGYTCSQDTYTLTIGRVSALTGIRIRERASTESDALGRLVDGNIVIQLDPGNRWSKIRFGDCVGYVKNSFVDYYEQEMAVLHYKAEDSDVEYTIGCSADDYRNGGTLPSEAFSDYLASGGSLDAYEELGTYARVNTGGPDVTLNLRDAPNTDSPILATLPDGTEARIVLHGEEWTLVEYQDMTGYLMTSYLEFLTDPEEDDGFDDADRERYYGVVKANKGKQAEVYDMDSDDAELLGHLKNGVKVEILRAVDDWCLISYMDHTGYMKDDDLEFLDLDDI